MTRETEMVTRMKKEKATNLTKNLTKKLTKRRSQAQTSPFAFAP